MKIYNSLARKKEEFDPSGIIKIYVCGPTVYDEPHIGHARSAYVFDVIRKYLVYKGYKVNFVRNVTDVDDKIIDKARREFSGVDLNESVRKVSEKYLAAYHEDMALLGIMLPDAEPKATDYVKSEDGLGKIQKFIKKLIENNVAYVSGGDVYFDIRKAKDYGKLSNQNLEKMEAGARPVRSFTSNGTRITPGENKKDPLDFVLWKKAKEGEPSWDSPWGKGRPGWHIECSVMSSDILGEEFDIHGGGIDLIFPHHENEIAQSEGAGMEFARVWMHNGLLTINGEKMAKSLGNFISIKEFGKSFDLLKLLFLSSHYRHPVDYSEDKIEEMREKSGRVMRFLQKADTALQDYNKRVELNNAYFIPFKSAMDDDFNTPEAWAVISKCVEDGNKIVDKKNLGKKLEEEDLKALYNMRFFIRNVSKDIFGLTFDYGTHNAAIIAAKVFEREKARENKDFKKADKIRKELLEQGIIVEDTKEGPRWRKV